MLPTCCGDLWEVSHLFNLSLHAGDLEIVVVVVVVVVFVVVVLVVVVVVVVVIVVGLLTPRLLRGICTLSTDDIIKNETFSFI